MVVTSVVEYLGFTRDDHPEMMVLLALLEHAEALGHSNLLEVTLFHADFPYTQLIELGPELPQEVHLFHALTDLLGPVNSPEEQGIKFKDLSPILDSVGF